MNNEIIKKNNKLQKLLKIINISKEEVENLNFRDKQKYYYAKSKLCKVSFVSRDKNGKGITYRKLEEGNKRNYEYQAKSIKRN